MAELDVFHIERNGLFALGDLHYLFGRYEQELGLVVDELPDQPRAGDPVYLHAFTCDPLHDKPPMPWNYPSALNSSKWLCASALDHSPTLPAFWYVSSVISHIFSPSRYPSILLPFTSTLSLCHSPAGTLISSLPPNCVRLPFTTL